jgi:hypothetical protein
MAEPIATYRERRFAWKREFTLFEDRLQISGGVFGKAHEKLETPLKVVRVDVENGSITDTNLRGWLLTLTAAVLVLGVGIPEFARGMSRVSFGPAYVGIVVLAVIALLLAAFLVPRPLHFTRFLYNGGGVAFDVVRMGVYKNQYEPFVRAVRTQISALEAITDTPHPGTPNHGVQPTPESGRG